MNDLHRNSRPCSRPPKSGEASPSGFTLIELLVVVSIMILVYGFVAPAMTSSQEKNSLYLAGQMVADELVVARQYAASRNQTVQVRFITLTSFAQAVTPNRTGYNGIQLWQTTVTGTSAIDQINRLPDGTEISSKSALSPLVAYTGTDALATGTGSPPYPLAGSQAERNSQGAGGQTSQNGQSAWDISGERRPDIGQGGGQPFRQLARAESVGETGESRQIMDRLHHDRVIGSQKSGNQQKPG